MATEPGTAIDKCFLLQSLEFSLNPGDQLLLGTKLGLVGLSFNCVPHKKSIKFKSGEFKGQTSRPTYSQKFSLSQFCHFLDVWHGAESCCHTWLSSSNLLYPGQSMFL